MPLAEISSAASLCSAAVARASSAARLASSGMAVLMRNDGTDRRGYRHTPPVEQTMFKIKAVWHCAMRGCLAFGLARCHHFNHPCAPVDPSLPAILESVPRLRVKKRYISLKSTQYLNRPVSSSYTRNGRVMTPSDCATYEKTRDGAHSAAGTGFFIHVRYQHHECHHVSR